MNRFLVLLAALPLSCVPPVLDEEPEERSGLGVLGYASHAMDAVQLDEVATRSDGLRGPRDLDFNPEVPGELWIVNRADDSVVTLSNTGTSDQQSLKRIDPFALHFMEEVSSISFATGLKFGTCQESRNTYNGQAEHNDFMGPTLWSADPAVFAKSNPEAVAALGYDLGSHLDMLHNSPLCMGIAWERENIYWTFDGLHGVLSRYDFAADHRPGFDDHSDGVIERFNEVDVLRVENVPSHMVFDRDSGLLYVADTGNARIGVLDPSGATVESTTSVHEGSPMLNLTGAASWAALVADGLELPSGIALHDGVLYVTDNATSRISAFSLDGVLLDYLDTGLPEGSLMGIRVYEGALFVVDNIGERVLRLRAKE